MKNLRDTWLIYQRSLMLTIRNPVWIFVGLTQPIFFLVLFGPLLKGLAVIGASVDETGPVPVRLSRATRRSSSVVSCARLRRPAATPKRRCGSPRKHGSG